MYYDFGGAPYGPAGTGKTETVKDLSKRIARNCFVFNCSSGMELGQMAELLSGVVACGYWSCFDEFNRIHLSVLQVLSELFIKIQQTKQLNKERLGVIAEIDINGALVPFKPECGLFITMNPYLTKGRNKLPSNLKNLFRVVTMIVPDTVLIAQ
jgi:dynein heavy chain